MSEATSEPGLRLRAPAESLDRRVRRLWRIQIALVTAAVVVVAGATAVVLAASAAAPVAWLAAAVAGVAVAGMLVAAVVPPIAFEAIRFEVTPLGLVVQSGWITRSLTIVPHSRIQSVRTTTDPLGRALGLATVEVRTAGSAVARIPGLDAARVESLRTELAAMAGTGLAT